MKRLMITWSISNAVLDEVFKTDNNWIDITNSISSCISNYTIIDIRYQESFNILLRYVKGLTYCRKVIKYRSMLGWERIIIDHDIELKQ